MITPCLRHLERVIKELLDVVAGSGLPPVLLLYEPRLDVDVAPLPNDDAALLAEALSHDDVVGLWHLLLRVVPALCTSAAGQHPPALLLRVCDPSLVLFNLF